MSTLLDETAADVPVRDLTVNLSRLAAGPQDLSVYQNARARQDISRVSREELEDRFLRLHEETLHLRQHINKQDDKIKKLGTKLMRLVKDRGRMEQLAAGGAGQPVCRVRDVGMEEIIEELQDKVRGLQTENEGLKQRLLVAKQQLLNSQSSRPSPYGHVQSRVNSGLKKLRDDTSSPSQTRPKNEHFPMVLVLCVAEQSWVDREYAAVGAAGVEGAGAGRAISELHHLCSESSRPRSRVKPDRELGDPSENYGFKIRAEISEQQTCIVPRTDVQVGQVCVKMLLLERTAH